MKVSEYERIKELVAKAKEDSIRAKGSIDRLNEQLEKEYDIHSQEEGKEVLTSLNKEIEESKEELASLIKELEESADWEAL